MHITGSQKYTHAPENHQIPTYPSRANFYLLCEASQHALINSSYVFLQKLAQVDEMVGQHQRLNRHEFERTPGDNKGQVCCSPWGRKVRHDLETEQKLLAVFFFLRCCSFKQTVSSCQHESFLIPYSFLTQCLVQSKCPMRIYSLLSSKHCPQTKKKKLLKLRMKLRAKDRKVRLKWTGVKKGSRNKQLISVTEIALAWEME